MIPYLHLGPLTIPTFGLMVATALIVSAYILQGDFNRRGFSADAFAMITFAAIFGIAGAKLYHLLESPAEFFANPLGLFFSRYGFAWFGGFIGGFGAILFMGWRARLPLLQFLDACSPAACFGYAIGRIGCLLSGDGDYGRPTSLPWGMSFPDGVIPTLDRVHPTPLYEFAAWCLIGALLWHLGNKALQQSKSIGERVPAGETFCLYLILTGIARFLVEIIRINPRSFLGMTNAQSVSVLSVIAGLILLARLKIKNQQQATVRGRPEQK